MATKTPAKTSAKTTAKTPAKPDPKAAKSAASAKPETRAASASKVPVAPKGKEPPKKEAASPKKTDDRASTARETREDRASTARDGRDEPATMPKIAVAAPASEERVSITTTMSKTQLQRFRKLLEEKRDDIIKKAKETLEEDMTLDTNDLPDEMDLASSEYLQSFTFRLRGREKSFLDKINKALERIENQSFGVCEECGDEISVKRLEARPETTLCIRCKEDQERAEKDYG
jgi:DnaK suppressor protein